VLNENYNRNLEIFLNLVKNNSILNDNINFYKILASYSKTIGNYYTQNINYKKKKLILYDTSSLKYE
jgi:hypothetical protein